MVKLDFKGITQPAELKTANWHANELTS